MRREVQVVIPSTCSRAGTLLCQSHVPGLTPSARALPHSRPREDSPDLSLVDDGSEGEAEEEEESEEAEMSDYETPEESDEDEVAAKAVAGMPSPRRQSGRHRGTPRKVLKEASVSSGSGGGGSERSASSSEGGGDGSSEGEDGESGDESGDSVSRGGGNGRGRGRGRPGQHSPAKPKRASFVVVKEEEDSTGGSIVLPKLAGVPVEWPTGDDALCTVCGDGEDADGNAVLLCEGHGCSVAVHQQVGRWRRCGAIWAGVSAGAGISEADKGVPMLQSQALLLSLLWVGKWRLKPLVAHHCGALPAAAIPQCYGVSKVPKGKWLCDACKAKLSTAAPNCACCPVVGGAVRKVSGCAQQGFLAGIRAAECKGGALCSCCRLEWILVQVQSMYKPAAAMGLSHLMQAPAKPGRCCLPCPVPAPPQVVSLGRVVPASRPAFVHVACTLWTPEITLAEPEAMRGVQLDAMTTLRAELQCALCKQAGGAVV